MVEVRGPCYSACTLVAAHVDMEQLLLRRGRLPGIPRGAEHHGPHAQRNQQATDLMYLT